MNDTIWMVRAGRGAAHIDDFIESECVAIGFKSAGEVETTTDKSELESRLAEAHPKESKRTVAAWAAQVKRYHDEISVGDKVTSYDPNQRLYYLGEVLSDVENRDHDLCRARKVRWTHQVARDSLKSGTRNSLGSISTMFQIRDEAAADMLANAVAIGSEQEAAPNVSEESEKPELRERLECRGAPKQGH